jgi:hypothetical protein
MTRRPSIRQRGCGRSVGPYVFALLWIAMASGSGAMSQARELELQVTADSAMKQKVDALFADFVAETFVTAGQVQDNSGWTMSLESGRVVTRSFLQQQAAPVIALGPDAVPHLFTWVMHGDLPIRYIAIYSLEQISGLKPYIPYFDRDDPRRHRDRAIATWREWWLRRPAGGVDDDVQK